jgi:hypothetical protein
VFQGIVEVVSERHRELRGRPDNAGKPNDGNDVDQNIDDLGGRRTSAHRRISLLPIGWACAADCDQGGEADERLGLRIQTSRLAFGSAETSFPER